MRQVQVQNKNIEMDYTDKLLCMIYSVIISLTENVIKQDICFINIDNNLFITFRDMYFYSTNDDIPYDNRLL